jgi:hypothetical protein
MTVSKATTPVSKRPLVAATSKAAVTPAPKPVGVSPKATSSGDPNQIIDRKLVAQALDRPGNDGRLPDGIVSDDELSRAGIKLDADAKAIINEGGDQGDKITVGELTQALLANRVSITGEGNVRMLDGFATFTNGRIQTASPWSFPGLPGLTALQTVVREAPGYGDGLDPDSPGSQYTETRRERVGSYYEGRTLQYNEYVGDSNGTHLSADANGKYPAGSSVWRNYTVVFYGAMRDELMDRARDIQYATSGATDPELQTINREVTRLISDASWGGSSESQAQRLYSGLAPYSRISVPTSPRARMGGLDDSINAAVSALNDHFRILQQVPVERARDVVTREVERLKAPMTATKGIGAVLAGVGGAALGFFGLPAMGVALAGGALIAATAGIAVAGLGLGYFIGKLINDSQAKGVQEDLKVLETISPEKNKQDLNQYSLQAYKLLQDARTVTTLARLRAYDEDARGVQGSVDKATSTIKSQAASLRDIQKLVEKYASK